MSEFPLPAEIIRLIEERGRDGRDILFETQLPDKIARLCAALAMAQSAHVRRVLCNLLASLAEAEALPCLLDRLDDPSPSVVAAAADGIGNCAYQQGLPQALKERLGVRLMELVANDASVLEVRTGALYALGLLQYLPAQSLMLQFLESEVPRERLASAEALGHLGDRGAIAALRVRRYRENDEHVRRYVSLAIEELEEK
nr:HEAT repeat domain-containing protein [uncultured Duganella sp.]